ncbi:UDP-N-acetylmuramoyl-tripeptide--D-alanyl-D-alanine ligase [Chlamydia trachomatis]|nr:UDP-N-acetylmuramoyl-tripeptide--D-alanyl-D-alanine ligase [Chlamydia trachomatis]
MRPILLEEWSSLLLGMEIPRSGKKVTGVAIDSRLVLPGDVFFALPGNRTSGHLFLKQAAQSGAVAAVVASDYHGPGIKKTKGLPHMEFGQADDSLSEQTGVSDGDF